MLTERTEYLEGQKFLSRHKDSEIICRTKSIIADKFSDVNQSGWQSVIGASNFYPELTRFEKEIKLEEAGRRLTRWFEIV
ncbi:MAG: hypothetical protein ABFD79_16920 [Phycisphaerales bacterium]